MDTKHEEIIREFAVKFYHKHEERGLTYLRNEVVEWLRTILTSRDTYWKEQLQKAREEGYNEGSDAQLGLMAKTVHDNAHHLEDQLINIGLNNDSLRGAVTTNQIIDVFKTFYASRIITSHSELDQDKK